MTSDAARLEIHRSVAEGQLVLHLVGDLDPHTAPTLTEAIEATEQDCVLVLDLENVAFLDSAGLRVLITAHDRAQTAGGELRLRRPSESARRVLELTGLTDHLVIEN